MHIEKTIAKMQKNLVKLPHSPQKVLLRASSLVLFFVLIFPLKVVSGIDCKCVTALLTLTEAMLKYPRYRQNKKGSTNFFTLY